MKNLSAFALFFLMVSGGYSQIYISKQDAIDDLDFYHKNLMEIHYDPFLYVEKDNYFAEVEKIKSGIKDSIKFQDFILSLYSLSGMMEDSHSSPALQQFKIKDELKKKQFFPYRTILENDKLYVSNETSLNSGIPAGSEITAINDTEVGPILKNYQKLIGGIPEYKKEMTSRFLFNFLYYSNIKAPFNIEYTEPSGKKGEKLIAEGIDHTNGIILAMPKFKEGNYFEVLNNKVGYIKFSDMSGSIDEWIKMLKTAFAEFKEKNIQHVAVDIRENAGGNSLFGEVLFGFLTPKEYQLQGYRKWKVSQQYKDHLLANGNNTHEYLQKENGSVWERAGCEPAVSLMPVTDKFQGQVFMITGPFTFSSGNMVADGAKQYQIARLIGEPTGENTTDFGESYSLTLPKTGVVMNLTTSMDIGADCNPNAASPVIPDVLINSTLQDKIHGKDKALEYVLSQVKSIN